MEITLVQFWDGLLVLIGLVTFTIFAMGMMIVYALDDIRKVLEVVLKRMNEYE